MKCLKCGKCCTEKTVTLSDLDIIRILEITDITFYRIRNTGSKVLNWKSNNNSHICIFLNPHDKLCTIYNHRPFVCREHYCANISKVKE